jgi:hypothetical protein
MFLLNGRLMRPEVIERLGEVEGNLSSSLLLNPEQQPGLLLQPWASH